ncbi:FUSC family protein [Streptococcus sp. SR1]|nr:aromatic acid exporter family protein [Streptococcus sp. SR1]EUC80366.1 PF06081 family protein [Streptococcus sp. SR1]
MSYFKKYKFDKSQFKLGMRTFKTGIAVFLVLLIFGFFGWKGLQIGALTAVFSLRESFDKSVHFGTSRILGNSIGGFYALIFFLLNTLFHEAFWVTLVVVPICTMLTIMTNVAMNNKSGVIGGVAAMLIITLSIPSGETILYVFARVSETFMGVFVAILVNYDIDRIHLFLEKKKIMLHFVTLLIDVCLFLDYNRQKEGKCK